MDDSGKVSDAPLAETVTAAQEGKDGYYFFDNLTKGRYVVEFDITSLRNDLGLYQYGFTTANQGAIATTLKPPTPTRRMQWTATTGSCVPT